LELLSKIYYFFAEAFIARHSQVKLVKFFAMPSIFDTV